MIVINDNSVGKIAFVLAFYTNENIVYMDYDDIEKKLINPQSLTVENYQSVAKFFSNKEKNKKEKYFINGFIPKNILYFEKEKNYVIWTTEPGIRKQIFKNDSIKSGNYPVPKLLWKYKSGKLWVYALKESDDKLYNAPFLNVYSDGSVCLGSTKFRFKNKNYVDIITCIENSFYSSYFTHTNLNNIIDGNLIDFYKENKNKKIFPEKLLVLNQTKKEELL